VTNQPMTEGPLTAESVKPTTAVVIGYVCRPGEGSEAGTSWAFTRAASKVARVVLFTVPDVKEDVDAKVAEEGLPIEARYVAVPPPFRWLGSVPLAGPLLAMLGYLTWHLKVAMQLRRLERSRVIDVVHHVGFSSDSLPTALLVSRAPVRIWGPVGGASPLVPGTWRYLTARGAAREVVRSVCLGAMRHSFGAWVARRATLVLALNGDVHRALAPNAPAIEICPHIALDPSELEAARAAAGEDRLVPSSLRTAIFAGRLLDWKGVLLAVETMRFACGWRLVVIGDGPARNAAVRRARRRGLSHRVEFLGRLARQELLALYARSDALLFPSLHDSGGWVAAEASALGCPVVCLDIGGPRLRAGRNAHVVPARPARSLPVRLARQLEAICGRGVPDDMHLNGMTDMVRRWYGPATEKAYVGTSRR